MALTKVQADGINLADTFAFTGTVSGSNTYVPLLNVDNISNVASYHINNTYINDSYDYYLISGFLKPASDGVYLYQRMYTSTSQDNGALIQSNVNYHSWEYGRIGGTDASDNDQGTQATMHYTTLGNGLGEGIHFHNHFYVNNEKTNNAFYHGSSSSFATNGAHTGTTTSGAMGGPTTLYQYSVVGVDYRFSSGNITSGRINVYGVKCYV
jgi:hypothetical protein